MSESIQQMFVAAAAKFADHTAIEHCGERLTYRELDARSNTLASLLTVAGAGKGTVVAILAEDPVRVMTTIIGILKAGAVFVPLDPHIPEKRLKAMLSLVNPGWFVLEATLYDKLCRIVPAGDFKARVLCLDQENIVGAKHPQLTSISAQPADCTRFTPVASDPDDLCYIYFTSGSTGSPKAIAGRLKGIDHFIRWEIETLGISPADRVSHLLPSSFDGSLRDIFIPLCSGGTACIPESKETILDAGKLAAWIEQQRISIVHCVPSLFRSLVNGALNSAMFSSLRYILMAGEALLPADVARWMDIFGERIGLVNLYGTSETTMAKFSYFVTTADRHRRSIPIGKPIRGAKALLVDEQGKPCSPGTIGEIYIRTPYRAHGYYNQPELTQQVFIQNPFSNDPGDIVYRTGDLARVLEDGNFEYLGRRDQQVKIRGIRVELKEIESLLRGHQEVADVAVIDRADAAGDNYLCAYLVMRNGTGPEELRGFLADLLPDYMVPSAFVMLDELPLTISGKVDRRALPVPGHGRAGLQEEYVAPSNSVEDLLAGIWTQVLGVAQIGVHDNFFQLGGHSLKATQVVSRLRPTFDVEIPLSILLEAPTVAGLARHVEAAVRGDQVPRLPPIVRNAHTGRLPLSYAQQRLWFLHQLEPRSAAYNMPVALHLAGPFNVSALDRAINELLRRHESLRTNFDVSDGRPVQVIAPSKTLTVPLIDLSDLSSGERETEVKRMIGDEVHRPFDLSVDSLLRVSVLRVAADEHVALLTMHHIISDGWSTGILVQEIAPLYEAFAKNELPSLPEVPVQYADFTIWQHQILQGEFLKTLLAYWTKQLGGELPVLDMPTDRRRPTVQTFNGKRQSLQLAPDLTRAIESLSQEDGATVFMTLLAIFNILLARYSGAEDIIVGTDVAGRNQLEVEALIGLFVNQLVMRTDLSGRPTFRELLIRVRTVALGAYAHQDLPFDKLVEALNPKRDLSRSPLFQAMLVVQNAPMPDLQLSGLTMSPLPTANRTSKFDLCLYVVKGDAGLFCELEYNTDLFDDAVSMQLLEHFQRLLEGAVANPDECIWSLPLLTAGEREYLLYELNDTEVGYPQEALLHELFEAQARRTPAAVAVSDGERSLSYAELNEQAEKLARRLRRRHGVRAETAVALYLPPTVGLVVAALGVLKAGGAYVPLERSQPPARLAFILADTGAPVLLTEQAWRAEVPPSGIEILCLDEAVESEAGFTEIGATAAVGDEAAPRVSQPQNLVYILYTSGSTGQPKGVMVTHGGVVNYLHWAAATYRLNEGWGAPVHSPLGFDLTVTSLWGPLVSGGRVEFVGPGLGVEGLAAALGSGRNYSLVKLTPSHLELLATAGVAGAAQVGALVIGGEALQRETLREWQEQAPETRLINEYGPTETVVGCCSYEVGGRAEETQSGAVPIGRAIANTQVYVLDEDCRPQPVGVAGELYIGGAGVARGYLKRPELTAAGFVPDPFGQQAGGRLYRTGDVGRWRGDGELEYLGRRDEQVKVRGYRVELGEIEAVLSAHPDVCQAVVVLREDKQLVAYLVGRSEGGLRLADLRGFLNERLPAYMIPNTFVSREALPVTSNGKLDRRALPDPEQALAALRPTYVPPRTVIEELLASIWAEVLDIGRVGVQDNFFELGGHSLQATQVVSRVREAFQIDLALSNVFTSPTVAGLAADIEQAHRGESCRPAPPILPAPRHKPLPLSHAQQRLWFLYQLQPANPAFNIYHGVRLSGTTDVKALERSLNEVVRRHEALRTIFDYNGDEAVQIIQPSRALVLPLIELEELPEPEQEAEVQRLLKEEALRLFNLTTGPLLRATLLKLAPREHVLLLAMHHIVSDGWSMGVLVGELTALYEAFASGKPSPLDELTIQYPDYAHWQRLWLSGEVLEGQLGYWKKQLRGSPALLELPLDHARPPVQRYRGAKYSFTLPARLAESLRRLSRREGATLFMTLLAAWNVLLQRYTWQDDIVVGTNIANRNRTESEGLIGFFVNNLALRTDLSGNPTFRELLKRVRRVTLEAYEHQDVPFEMVVEALQPAYDPRYTPLFQVLFVLQNAPIPAVELSMLRLTAITSPHGSSKFDVALYVNETEQGLTGLFEHNTDLFEAGTIKQMAAHYQSLLEDIADSPDKELHDLSTSGTEVDAQLVYAFNDNTD
jgi:amino acid adenylation domain-containing protein